MPDQPDALRSTILLVAAGDRGAFERLYDETGADTFGILSRVLPVRLAEETFIRFWESVWSDAGPLVSARFDSRVALMGLAVHFASRALRPAHGT